MRPGLSWCLKTVAWANKVWSGASQEAQSVYFSRSLSLGNSQTHIKCSRAAFLTSAVWGTVTDWHESSIFIDRKSKFQARVVPITDPEQVPAITSELLAENKHIAKASHPHILAWRTTNPLSQGYKDGGEKGAGYRLLLLVLERHNVSDVLVIVTRWYGGSPIGSLRFRHINNSAQESLRKGGWI